MSVPETYHFSVEYAQFLIVKHNREASDMKDPTIFVACTTFQLDKKFD
jgi:hypothetical protein